MTAKSRGKTAAQLRGSRSENRAYGAAPLGLRLRRVLSFTRGRGSLPAAQLCALRYALQKQL